MKKFFFLKFFLLLVFFSCGNPGKIENLSSSSGTDTLENSGTDSPSSPDKEKKAGSDTENFGEKIPKKKNENPAVPGKSGTDTITEKPSPTPGTPLTLEKIEDFEIDAYDSLEFPIKIKGKEKESLTFEIATPSRAKIDPEEKILYWKPSGADLSKKTDFSIKITDTKNSSGILSFKVYVNDSSFEDIVFNFKKFFTTYEVGLETSSSLNIPNISWKNLEPLKDKIIAFDFASILEEEWNKYPFGWISGSGLTSFIIIKNLKINDNSFGISERFGATYPEQGLLFLNPSYMEDILKEEIYIRKSIHHEFYHLVEAKYFGSYYYQDQEWINLNAKDFKYGKSGASAYSDPSFKICDFCVPGFVSYYATYSCEEDKAEMYSYLMTTEKYKILVKEVEKDEILKRKFDYMKKFIKSKNPEMDDNYFNSIHGI